MNMTLPAALLIVLIIILLYLIYDRSDFNCINVVANDGNEYCMTDARGANLMAEIHVRVVGLLRELKRKYITNSSNNASYGTDITRKVLERYNPNNIIETPPNNLKNDTSYTIGKGKILALCIRNKDGTYVDINTLMYVVIHELGHLGVHAIDHENEFKQAFGFLLREATLMGIYNDVDYSKNPTYYCNMVIT